MTWHRPSGSLARDGLDVHVGPETAGWTYSGMQVWTLRSGEVRRPDLSRDEAVLVPLSAEDVTVVVDGAEFRLRGRAGVFAAVSDWMYLPLGSDVTVSGRGGEIALCTARAGRSLAVAHVRAEDVPVEVRGAGASTRQVTNIATPESFTGADRINVVEVIAPGGNWSSWPSHRHDGIGDCPVANEELYYFRIGRLDSPHGDPEGRGLFHVYTVDGTVDETVTIADGDVYLVPQGYHGPSVSPPEYPLYFLNVLAGPGEERTMAFCDDPSHHWVRGSWERQAPDPRLPWTTAAGRTAKEGP